MTLTSLALRLTRPVPAGSEAKAKEHRLRRFIPYLAHYDGETLLTEDDQLVQIIKLEGLAFQTRDEGDVEVLRELVREVPRADAGAGHPLPDDVGRVDHNAKHRPGR